MIRTGIFLAYSSLFALYISLYQKLTIKNLEYLFIFFLKRSFRSRASFSKAKNYTFPNIRNTTAFIFLLFVNQ